MSLNAHLWQVSEIAAMPGVEPVCRPFSILGWPTPGKHVYGNGAMVLGGRLIFQPVG